MKRLTVRLDDDKLRQLKFSALERDQTLQTMLAGILGAFLEQERARRQTRQAGMRDFFIAQKENLARALQFEPFAVLFSPLNALYELTISLSVNNSYGRFTLMCHRAFLTAASLIGEAQPDDADPVTRRAIEMIQVAAATKHDPDFSTEWLSFEKRHKRWMDRQQGQTPKRLNIHIPVHHPVVKSLMMTYGILSDSGVHFTPEYFSGRRWELREDSLFLQYFEEQRAIERAILLLTATHLEILQVLDYCLDGVPGRDERWVAAMKSLYATGQKFSNQFMERYGVAPDGFDSEGEEEQST